MNQRTALAWLSVLVAATALAVVSGAGATAPPQDQDPFTGTWKLDPGKSRLPPPAPRDLVTHIECDDKGVSVLEEIVDADGKSAKVTGKAGFDGKDYPVAGTPFADTISYERVDLRTIKGTSKKNGKIVTHETVVVSPDGKTMTATYEGEDAQGKRVVATAVFQKQ